jgi:quinol monooxygenase YgiN
MLARRTLLAGAPATFGKSMTRFGLFGKLLAVAGKRDELAALLLEAAHMLGQDAQCLLYLINVSDKEPDAIFVTEVWAARSAHAASLQREDVRALIAKARPLLSGGGERFELTVLGGKGLEA